MRSLALVFHVACRLRGPELGDSPWHWHIWIALTTEALMVVVEVHSVEFRVVDQKDVVHHDLVADQSVDRPLSLETMFEVVVRISLELAHEWTYLVHEHCQDR